MMKTASAVLDKAEAELVAALASVRSQQKHLQTVMRQSHSRQLLAAQAETKAGELGEQYLNALR